MGGNIIFRSVILYLGIQAGWQCQHVFGIHAKPSCPACSHFDKAVVTLLGFSLHVLVIESRDMLVAHPRIGNSLVLRMLCNIGPNATQIKIDSVLILRPLFVMACSECHEVQAFCNDMAWLANVHQLCYHL